MEVSHRRASFADVVDFYEEALFFAEAQQTKFDNTREDLWDYAGVYEDGKQLKITVRDRAEKVSILLVFLDELELP